jgi:hypothetical protein
MALLRRYPSGNGALSGAQGAARRVLRVGSLVEQLVPRRQGAMLPALADDVYLDAGAVVGITGLASGVLSLSAAANGGVATAGLASGVINVSGAASGLVISGISGASTALIALSSVATGTNSTAGAASAVIALAGAAVGALDDRGAAAGVISIANAAAGTVGNAGVAAGAVLVAGAAAGNVVSGVAGTASGVIALASAATGTVNTSGVAAGVVGLTGDALGAAGGAPPPALEAGGGASHSAKQRVIRLSEIERLVPLALRKRYAKDTPAAETARRIAKAITQVRPEAARDAVTARGLDALRDSHAQYYAYIGHLLAAWQVPDLSAVNDALLHNILCARNRAEMAQAAAALADALDDEEAILLMMMEL